MNIKKFAKKISKAVKVTEKKIGKAVKATEEKLDKMIEESFDAIDDTKEKFDQSFEAKAKKVEEIKEKLDESGVDFMLDPKNRSIELVKKVGTRIVGASKKALKKTEEALDQYIDEEE